MSGNSESPELATGGEEPHARLPIEVRQSFYEGLGRECLKAAWGSLDEYRRGQMMKRTFRGVFTERKGIPLEEIGLRLSRSRGEITRLFQGNSPDWSNLMMVMTSISADWPDLQRLPEKQRRKNAGCYEALRKIRRRVEGEVPNDPTDPVRVLEVLEILFRDEQWFAHRQFPQHREAALERIAGTAKLSARLLDAIDRVWGHAYTIWIREFADSMDEQIWQ